MGSRTPREPVVFHASRASELQIRLADPMLPFAGN